MIEKMGKGLGYLVILLLMACSGEEGLGDSEEIAETNAPEEAREPEREPEQVSALRKKFKEALDGNLPEQAEEAREKLKALNAEVSDEEAKRFEVVKKELADLKSNFDQAAEEMDLETARTHLAQLENVMGDTSKQGARLQEVETHHIEKAYPNYTETDFKSSFNPKAIDRYRSGAVAGNRFAQVNLGFLYCKGIGVEVDYKRSFDLLSQAANQNLAMAQVFLGELYVDGKGVNASAEKGFEWVQKAARQGFVIGQVMLASFYVKGIGVETSSEEAGKWLERAAAQGSEEAIKELARLRKENKGPIFRTPDDLEFEMINVQPGSFQMGSPEGEEGRNGLQERSHGVIITKSFWMGKTEVTQKQWLAIMKENPSAFQDPERPVEQVSWKMIQVFLERLNKQMVGVAVFRLPSEAEWEYACRAGATGAYAGKLNDLAWYSQTSTGSTQPVGRKLGNAWGFHDMHGNVYEWCEDRWTDYPREDVAKDPKGGTFGKNRLYRGGGWSSYAKDLRSATRAGDISGYFADNLGFRLVCTIREGEKR